MGTPKHLISFEGESLLERLVRELGRVCSSVAAIGSDADTVSGIRHFPDKVIVSESVSGPLVGVYTALLTSETEWVAVVACDMPFVTSELIRSLGDFAENSVDAVVPVDAAGSPQPLCALYKRSVCLPTSEKLIADGKRSPRSLLDKVRARNVEFSELRHLAGSDNFFLNMNTPADLELAVKLTRSPA